MTKPDPTPYEQWAGELDSVGKKLSAHAKSAVAAKDDPFSRREQIHRADKLLDGLDATAMKGSATLRKSLDTQCVEALAEFWQRFTQAVKERGWEIHGSTDRRLVCRAFFVELKNEGVTIDGIGGKQSPHVPALMEAITPCLKELEIDKSGLQEFCQLLVESFDAMGGRNEVSIEAVFRQCILLMQPPAFWANVDASKFRPMSRPIFRYRLTALLADNVRSSDGRELRLFPTVNRKDVWELFSPAEGRVVQIGRLAFQKK